MRPSANEALSGETKTLESRCVWLIVFHRLKENLFDADRTSRSAGVRSRGSAVRAGPFAPSLASGFETLPPQEASVASASGATTRFIHEFDDDIPPPRTLVSTPSPGQTG